MFMDTIKSLIDKFKGEPKSELKELTKDADSALQELGSDKLVNDYKDWEETALLTLAENTALVNKSAKHLQETIAALQTEKEKLHDAAEKLADSNAAITEIHPEIGSASKLFPWDSPSFIAFLGDLRAKDEALKDSSIEELIQNVFTKDSFSQSLPLTAVEKRSTDIQGVLDELCTNLGCTMSLYLQSAKPLLDTSKEIPGYTEEIRNIIFYLMETPFAPILNYSFIDTSPERRDMMLELFRELSEKLKEVHKATLTLLVKIKEGEQYGN